MTNDECRMTNDCECSFMSLFVVIRGPFSLDSCRESFSSLGQAIRLKNLCVPARGLDASQKRLMRDFQGRVCIHLGGALFRLRQPGFISLSLPMAGHAGVKLVCQRNALRNRKREQTLGKDGGAHARIMTAPLKKSMRNFTSGRWSFRPPALTFSSAALRLPE